MKITRGAWAIIIILGVILADQVLKIWVKTHFFMGEDYEIFPWFQLKFIENNGMAFGLELWSKYALTFIRIAAVCVLMWIIYLLRDNRNIRMGCFIALALITAGAAGNIFDCIFYGVIFNNPYPPETATMFSGGYAPLFQGRVVDMLYFPFFTFMLPSWLPIYGGEEYEFFQYIFNIADASICIGVLLLILFYSKDFYEMLGVARDRLPWKKDRENEMK